MQCTEEKYIEKYPLKELIPFMKYNSKVGLFLLRTEWFLVGKNKSINAVSMQTVALGGSSVIVETYMHFLSLEGN